MVHRPENFGVPYHHDTSMSIQFEELVSQTSPTDSKACCFYWMIAETRCGDFVELVSCFARQFTVAFYALRSVTLHVVAPSNDVCLTVLIKLDIRTGGGRFCE